MKKFLSLIMCAVLGFALTGCGEKTIELQEVLDFLNGDDANATVTIEMDMVIMIEEMVNAEIEMENEALADDEKNDLVDFSDAYGTYVEYEIIATSGNITYSKSYSKSCLDMEEIEQLDETVMLDADFTFVDYIITDAKGNKVFTEEDGRESYTEVVETTEEITITTYRLDTEDNTWSKSEYSEPVVDNGEDDDTTEDTTEDFVLLVEHFELKDSLWVLTDEDALEEFSLMGMMSIVPSIELAATVGESVVYFEMDMDGMTLTCSMTKLGTTELTLPTVTESTEDGSTEEAA